MMVPWIVLLVATVFPLFWCGVTALIGRLGWARLAASYRTDAGATGQTFRGVSGMVGVSSYQNVLTVSIEPDGLRLAVMLPFRVGHPPVLIPWSDLGDMTKSTILWSTAYTFEAGYPQTVTVRLPERIIEAIAAHGS